MLKPITATLRSRTLCGPTLVGLALALAPAMGQAKRPRKAAPTSDKTVSAIIEVGTAKRPSVQAVVSVPLNGEVSGRVEDWKVDGHTVVCRVEVDTVTHPNAPDTVRAEVQCRHGQGPNSEIFQMRGELPLHPQSTVVLGAVGTSGGESVRVKLRWP